MSDARWTLRHAGLSARWSVDTWTREVARRYGGDDPVLRERNRTRGKQLVALRREMRKAATQTIASTSERDQLRRDLAAQSERAARCVEAETERDAAVEERDNAIEFYRAAAERAERRHAHVADHLLALRNVEPPAVDGCVKVRARDEDEAWRHAERLASDTGRSPDEFRVYACPVCPRQLLGAAKFWHVTNRDVSERTGRGGTARAVGHRQVTAEARREGRQLDQRLDPATVARLRAVRDEDAS